MMIPVKVIKLNLGGTGIQINDDTRSNKRIQIHDDVSWYTKLNSGGRRIETNY